MAEPGHTRDPLGVGAAKVLPERRGRLLAPWSRPTAHRLRMLCDRLACRCGCSSLTRRRTAHRCDDLVDDLYAARMLSTRQGCERLVESQLCGQLVMTGHGHRSSTTRPPQESPLSPDVGEARRVAVRCHAGLADTAEGRGGLGNAWVGVRPRRRFMRQRWMSIQTLVAMTIPIQIAVVSRAVEDNMASPFLPGSKHHRCEPSQELKKRKTGSAAQNTPKWVRFPSRLETAPPSARSGLQCAPW
jgi:hypothetical protein